MIQELSTKLTLFMKKPLLLPLFSVLLVAQFFLGGVNKVSGFKKTVVGLQNRFNPSLPLWFYRLAILGVIALEILAPVMVVLATLRKVNKELGVLSLILLALFTVWATYLYHFPPFGFTFYPFISNVSAVGGLLVLAVFLAKM